MLVTLIHHRIMMSLIINRSRCNLNHYGICYIYAHSKRSQTSTTTMYPWHKYVNTVWLKEAEASLLSRMAFRYAIERVVIFHRSM